MPKGLINMLGVKSRTITRTTTIISQGIEIGVEVVIETVIGKRNICTRMIEVGYTSNMNSFEQLIECNTF